MALILTPLTVKLDSNGVNIKSKNTKLTIDGKGIHINTKNKK